MIPCSVLLAAVSSAQAVGLRSGLPLRAVTVRPSADLYGRSQALSQRHPRLLITATTTTGITATTITDTTRVTGEDITPRGAPRRPPRQMRPRVTERGDCHSCGLGRAPFGARVAATFGGAALLAMRAGSREPGLWLWHGKAPPPSRPKPALRVRQI